VKTKKAKAQKAQAAAGTVRVATVSLPGAPARSYIVDADTDADLAFVPYKKEMGIRTTTHEPEVTFQEMDSEEFQNLYDQQRAFVKKFGTPAVGNIAMTAQPAALDRLLSDEQKEVLEEDDELGVVTLKGQNKTPLSDREGDDEEDEPVNARALTAKTPQAEDEEEEDEEEEEEDEEIEISRSDVEGMKKSELQDVARSLDIKGFQKMKIGKLRKAVLAAIPEEEEEEEEEDEE
jgi:hypothetical protein